MNKYEQVSNEFIQRQEPDRGLFGIDPAVKIYIMQAGGIFLGLLPISVYVTWWLWDWDVVLSILLPWIMAVLFYLSRLRWWSRLVEPHLLPAAPPAEPTRMNLVRVRHDTVSEKGHWKQEEYTLPGTPYALQVMARGVLNGRPFTESVWAGKGKPFSVPEFRKLRKDGLEPASDLNRGGGLFRYKNPDSPTQGIDLTQKGRELFEELADNDFDEFEDVR